MKKLFLMFALLWGCLSMNAQKAIETSNFLDNVYVGAQVGVTTPMTLNSVFPLNTQGTIRVGKDWTPVLGTIVEGTAFFNNNRFSYGSGTFVKSSTVSIGSTINLSNLFCGYNGSPRNFEVSLIGTLGWFHMFNVDPAEYSVIYYNNNIPVDVTTRKSDFDDDLVSKTGVDLTWNLGKEKAWQLYVEPAVYWNLTANKGGTIQFNRKFAQIGLAAGFNYKFKTSNGTHNFKVYDIAEITKDVNALRAENDALKARGPKIIEKLVEKTNTVVEKVDRITVICFAQNSDELSAEADNQIANLTAKEVMVVGYASPEGTAEYNKKLSQSRADVVKKALEKKGVKVTSSEGRGASDNNSNRIVKIISVE